jgi:hypothetical protein
MATLRFVVVTCVLVCATLVALQARADVAKPVTVDVPPSPAGEIPSDAPRDKVEEVDLDALEEDGPKKATTKAAHDGAGKTIIEEVKLDELDAAAPSPEYERSRWLLLLPLLAALVVVWNVDWRDARVKAAVSAARAQRAPKKKGAS